MVGYKRGVGESGCLRVTILDSWSLLMMLMFWIFSTSFFPVCFVMLRLLLCFWLLCFYLPSMSTEHRTDLDAGTALAGWIGLRQSPNMKRKDLLLWTQFNGSYPKFLMVIQLMLILVRVDLDPHGPKGEGGLVVPTVHFGHGHRFSSETLIILNPKPRQNLCLQKPITSITYRVWWVPATFQ